MTNFARPKREACAACGIEIGRRCSECGEVHGELSDDGRRCTYCYERDLCGCKGCLPAGSAVTSSDRCLRSHFRTEVLV